MSDVLKKFGRYFLLDHIAQGGMAEIFRARLASVDGAGRLLVIKRIQAAYGSNSEFLQMFRAEIKVTMGFNHANIAQLYDFGEEGGQPFIAMEFVDGRNLRQVLTRLNERKTPMPVEYASYVIEQAAAGLHYAHSFKDKITGTALNIVHRDISPQNILVSYEGTVKVIDFGIAKATTNIESTRAGVIKGKPSYLSPEQISGDVLDGRCDIFALGIVLWELLVGKKLFAGDNDLAVLKLIESCASYVKAPSEFNPAVPKELDYIVLRALAKSKEKRFQTAEEFQRALRKFIFTQYPDINAYEISSFVKELFKDDIVEDRKHIQRLNEKVEQLLFSDTLIASPNPDPTIATEESTQHTATLSDRPKSSSANSVYEASQPDEKVDLEFGGAVVNASAQQRAQVNAFGNAKPGSAAVKPAMQVSSATLRQATKSVEIERSKSMAFKAPAPSGGGWMRLVPLIAAGLGVVLFGPQFLPEPIASKIRALTGQDSQRHVETASTETGADRSISSVSPSDKAEKKGDRVTLKINVLPSPAGATITLNGKPIGADRPMAEVPTDEPLALSVQKPGYGSFNREFVIESRLLAGAKEYSMDVELYATKVGLLTIISTPSAEATTVIDGKTWTRQTPIEREQLPVGTYSIKLSNKNLGLEKTIVVEIEDAKIAAFTDVHLESKN